VLILGVEVLEFIDRSDEVLEAQHLQVVLIGIGIQLHLPLLLLLGLTGVPRVCLPPGLQQRLLVDLALLHNKFQYSGKPLHDPSRSGIEEAVLDVMFGAALEVGDGEGAGGLEDGGVAREEAVAVVHQVVEHLVVAQLQVVPPALLPPA
jgi:hypothetical protein